MATKKLSPNIVKVLHAADADGWIRKSEAPVSTSMALIDRDLIGVLHVISRGDGSGLVRRGHYLTKAGKAKVAELRAAQCAKPVCDVHDNDAPEIRAGDLIEIRRPNERRWAIRVEAYYGQNGWRGTQIRMVDGKPSRTRYTGELKPGEYIIVERAKPAAEPCRGCGGRPITSGGHNHRAGCETANPRAVAAEQPRKTVTASVKLTESQIDALHWLGAPTKVRETWYHPHGRTMKALRVRGLIANNELTHEGEAVYLASEPSTRLPIEFRHAWAGTKALTSEPAPAVEPDGPACLADRPEDQVPLVRLNQMQAKRQTAAERGEILTPVEAVLWQVVEYANMVRTWGMSDQQCRDKLNDIEQAIRKLEQR